jgi:hypothetical protein
VQQNGQAIQYIDDPSSEVLLYIEMSKHLV